MARIRRVSECGGSTLHSPAHHARWLVPGALMLACASAWWWRRATATPVRPGGVSVAIGLATAASAVAVPIAPSANQAGAFSTATKRPPPPNERDPLKNFVSPDDDVASRLLHDWFSVAPHDALAWVDRLPDSDTRDAWQLKLVRWAVQKDPAAAVPLLERIADQRRRTDAAVGLVRDWGRDDFENAAAWALAEPSPQRREKLLAELAAIAAERADPWR